MARELETNELNQMLSVVKKYYELGMNQEQIAREEFISKSSVCRLIKKAVASGFVRFQINYPVESVPELESQFHKKFELEKAFIAPAYTDDVDIRLKDTCKSLCADLCRIVQPDDIICVSWGTTLDQMADILSKEGSTNRKCSKIVMMNGSTAGDIDSTKSSKIVEEFADFFAAEGYLLPVPLIVDSARTAKAIREDSHVSYVMDFARQARIAVFSIGGMAKDSVLTLRGAYSKEDYAEAIKRGAVGDIAGHCFDINGAQVNTDMDERMMGLDFASIRAKEYRIGVAVGTQKAKAIIGALRGGLISRLYTDELTAKEVLRLARN